MVDHSLIWGKLDRDDVGEVARQSLAGHCADVAAIFAALLEAPGVGSRLQRLAARPGRSLSSVDKARLCWLVFLHDFGKANAGFQARSDRKAPMVGHIAPIAALLGNDPDSRLGEAAVSALGLDRLELWGRSTDDLFDAILSHHGKPWPAIAENNQTASYARQWASSGGYDPFAAVALLRAVADALFGEAFAAGATSLPETDRFVHAVAGLVQLADWIGSAGWEMRAGLGPASDRSAWARGSLAAIGIDAQVARTIFVRSGTTFESAFGFVPRAAQAAFAETPGAFAILESETGSGKTEAALWRFLMRFRAGAVEGLFFALPTRTAAVQLFRRIETLVRRVWPDEPPTLVLAVPGYLEDDRHGAMPSAPDGLDTAEHDDRFYSRWAAEHPKRYFAATISVGTIDQALLSVLRVKHAHLRNALLMRHMLVVDEVHASDSYMRRLIERLLRDHLAAGGEAILLSATLGAEARESLLRAGGTGGTRDIDRLTFAQSCATPYPLISTPDASIDLPMADDGRTKTVSLQILLAINDPVAIATCALEKARAGAKVLVIRNTVEGAIRVAHALRDIAGPSSPLLFKLNGIATLHHGRFAREDRRRLDAAVEVAVGKVRPVGGLVVVGTQTLEQSLDIDADMLISDLCPVDVLLQRLGRLHRHATESDGTPRRRAPGFERPQAVVLAPDRPLACYLPGRSLEGMAGHGLKARMTGGVVRGVYPNLLAIEATRRLLLDHPVWSIPAMNRELVERGLHSEAIEALIDTFESEEQKDWRRLWSSIAGGVFGDRVTANLGCIDRAKPFMDPANTFSADERIATRLGDEGLLVDLPEPVAGPFGETIKRLVIPAWMVDPTDTSVAIEVGLDGHLRIKAGGHRFRYDQLGLVRESVD